MSKFAMAPVELSLRESQLARLVATGYSNGEIAGLLSIRRQTVKNHVSAIFKKLCVSNRVQLTLALAKSVEQEVVEGTSIVETTLPSKSINPELLGTHLRATSSKTRPDACDQAEAAGP